MLYLHKSKHNYYTVAYTDSIYSELNFAKCTLTVILVTFKKIVHDHVLIYQLQENCRPQSFSGNEHP